MTRCGRSNLFTHHCFFLVTYKIIINYAFGTLILLDFITLVNAIELYKSLIVLIELYQYMEFIIDINTNHYKSLLNIVLPIYIDKCLHFK